MGDSTIKKKRFDGTDVEILGETYEAGQPANGDKHDWSAKIGDDKKDMLMFLETGLRYWYAEEGFGSEKRKTPA
jgi:hypothetical protein